MLNTAFAFGTNEQTGHSGGANGKRQLPTYAPQAEVFTIKEPLTQRRRCRLHHRHHRAQRDLGKIGAGNSPLDLERSTLACLGIDVVPVVKPERHVAVLADLEDHRTAHRVDRSRC